MFITGIQGICPTFTLGLCVVPPGLGSAHERGGKGAVQNVPLVTGELAEGQVAEVAQRRGTDHGALIWLGQLITLNHCNSGEREVI